MVVSSGLGVYICFWKKAKSTSISGQLVLIGDWGDLKLGVSLHK